MVNVLGLDNSFQVIFKNLCKIILKLIASKVGQDFSPVWWRFELAQVRLQLASQDLEGGRLADTVGAHQAKNFTGSGDGQTMQLEGVLGIPMGCMLLQITEIKINNIDLYRFYAFPCLPFSNQIGNALCD